jgi:TRAP-type transport system small permease protein
MDTRLTATPTPPLIDQTELPRQRLLPTRLSRGLDRLLGLAFCAVVLLNFASAGSRYLFKLTVLGVDEVQVYTVVWLVFVGGAAVAWQRSHLRMDVFSVRLESRSASLRDLLEHVLATAVCGTMSWVSLSFVLQIHGMGQSSDGAGIPMWIPHAAVLVGFALMTVAAAHGAVKSLLALTHATGRPRP